MGYIRPTRVSEEELQAEGLLALPAKELISLLNLNVDLDLALDLAAPIDLAVAANANVAAPIDAAVSANVLSFDSAAAASSTQQVLIDQYISGEAIAYAPQDALVEQGGETTEAGAVDPGTGTGDTAVGGVAEDTVEEGGDVLQGDEALFGDGLLNVDVQAAIDANLAAPVAGAVAANANIAAPIDASVAANIASVGSQAIAIADQTAIITQSLDGVTAEATADQTAEIVQ